MESLYREYTLEIYITSFIFLLIYSFFTYIGIKVLLRLYIEKSCSSCDTFVRFLITIIRLFLSIIIFFLVFFSFGLACEHLEILLLHPLIAYDYGSADGIALLFFTVVYAVLSLPLILIFQKPTETTISEVIPLSGGIKIDSSEKSFIFLSASKWNIPLGDELKKRGYDVKQYVDNKQSAEHLIRYGIEVKEIQKIDSLLFNISRKIEVDVAISDLKTNKAIFIIKQVGWTDVCLFYKGSLFSAIAANIKKTWNDYNNL